MTENLHTKFTTLEAQLLNQHNTLMLKLDALLSAMGAPPPTATTTLADVISVLRDIHTDTISIDQKLLIIRDNITNIYNLLLNIRNNIGFPTGDATTTVLGRLSAIEMATIHCAQALGIPTGDATTTVLGELYALSYTSTRYLPTIATNTGICQCGPRPPDANTMCSHPLVSTGMTFIPTGILEVIGMPVGNITIATWPISLPPGLQFGTDLFGTVTDEGSLRPTDYHSWAGWRIYVESESNNFALKTVTTQRYPTNTWVALDEPGLDEIAAIVSGSDSVKAYLCGPEISAPPPAADCAHPFASNSTWERVYTLGQLTARATTAQFPDPPPSGLTFGNYYSLSMPRSELSANWNGWRVFVQTDDSNYSDDRDRVTAYEPNAWRDLSGTMPKVFSVSLGKSLRVTLCPPISLPNCYTLSAIPGTVAFAGTIYQNMSYVQFPSEFATGNSYEAGGTWTQSVPNSVALGDFNGWTFRWVSGGAFRVVSQGTTGGWGAATLNSVTSTLTINNPTTTLFFDNWVGNGGSGQTYTVEICRPTPM